MELAMILAIDTLGERYGLLPSEVLARGSTLDMYIMDVALSYHDYKNKKANGKLSTQDYEQTDLQSMLERARAQHG
jgi:hypothetical protein